MANSAVDQDERLRRPAGIRSVSAGRHEGVLRAGRGCSGEAAQLAAGYQR